MEQSWWTAVIFLSRCISYLFAWSAVDSRSHYAIFRTAHMYEKDIINSCIIEKASYEWNLQIVKIVSHPFIKISLKSFPAWRSNEISNVGEDEWLKRISIKNLRSFFSSFACLTGWLAYNFFPVLKPKLADSDFGTDFHTIHLEIRKL